MHSDKLLTLFFARGTYRAYLHEEFPSLDELEYLTNEYFFFLDNEYGVRLNRKKMFTQVHADLLRTVRKLRQAREAE